MNPDEFFNPPGRVNSVIFPFPAGLVFFEIRKIFIRKTAVFSAEPTYEKSYLI